MSDSRFWRLIALLLVAGIFYVGHGLHENAAGLPSIDSPALAGAPWGDPHANEFYTVSDDGKTLFIWRKGKGVQSGGWVEAVQKAVAKEGK